MQKHEPQKTIILLAEAKDRIRQLVCTMLARHGYEVLTAHDAEEALKICEECRTGIDMLLTNIVMPGMDGFELARTIRAQRPEIKALVMSSHMDAQILKENPETGNGIDVVITDEFFPLSLLETIKSILDNNPTATSAV